MCAEEDPLNTLGEVQPQGQKVREEEARKIQSLVQCQKRRISENKEGRGHLS